MCITCIRLTHTILVGIQLASWMTKHMSTSTCSFMLTILSGPEGVLREAIVSPIRALASVGAQ